MFRILWLHGGGIPLIGVPNRVMVALNWLWAYFTHEHGARLITSSGHEI